MSTYSLVGSLGAVAQGAVAASITPAYGQSPTAGNLLVLPVVALYNAGGTVTPAPPAGWSSVGTFADGNSVTINTFYKIAAGGDATPTVAGLTGAVLTGRIAEFSGNPASGLSDQNGEAGGSTSSPITVSISNPDAQAGDLVIGVFGFQYSVATTSTISISSQNNGQSATLTSSSGTSNRHHYAFTWSTTTTNASADSQALSFTTTNITDRAGMLSSFNQASGGFFQVIGP